jgi:type IV pilus assembly protein PilC
MAYYFWHGLDFQGSRVSGAFKVPKRIDAIKKLRKKGIFRSRLHEISPYRLKSPVPLTQLVSILIQLERLQKSGFPLNRSLQLIVSETSDPPLAYALCKIRQDLQQGHSFSQAWLSQTALPEMVGRMLGVFESSGKLKEGLGHLLKFYESELQLRNEQIKLIHYPIILGLFFLVLGSGLLLFVIPMFKSLYHRLGPELFWLTRMLVKLSDSLLEQPLIWLSAMLLTGTGLIFLFRNLGWEKIRSWIPGFGQLDFLSRMLLYSRSMELQLKSGVLLNEALVQAEHLFSGSQQIKLKKVRKDITSGVSVSEAFNRHSGFPEPVLKQLSMVQSVDDLGTGFEKNVQYYEESITRNTAKLNAMIEPLMMVFLAGMVLVFLLALYLPLFQLGEWI